MSYTNELNLHNEDQIYNSPNSPNRFNRTYNILGHFNNFKSSKTYSINITKNLKKNIFSHNKRIISQDYLKQNYLYNHEKILTLYQNNKLEKEKRCKTFDINKQKKIVKSLGSLHRNLLKNRLTQSNLYKLIEKSANDNYIKKKKEREKNTFITMIEEDNKDENNILDLENQESLLNKRINEESNITNDYDNNYIENYKDIKKNKLLKNYKYNNNIINNKRKKNAMLLKFNKNITNKKISISNYNNNSNNILSEPKLNSYNNKDNKKNILKKKVNFNQTFVEKNKSLDLSKLKPIFLPSIKFNSTLSNYFQYIIEGNRNDKHTLAKTCIAKLRFEIINKALMEHYKTTLEKNEFPINLVNTMFNFYLKGQKYFFEFDDLYKKYLAFLSLEIKKYNLELNDLLEQREILFNENNIILKRIIELKEEIKMYEAFKRLCLMIKYKKRNIDDIPKEEISKYGIINYLNNTNKNDIIEEKMKQKEEDNKNKDNSESNFPKKSLSKSFRNNSTKKRRGSNSKERKRASFFLEKKNFVIYQQIPIFENIDEFIKKFAEENEALFKHYEIYNNSYYEKAKLKSDIQDENKIEQSPESKYNINIVKKMNKELFLLKEKNIKLNIFKNTLLGKKNKNQNNISQISLFNINNNEKENNKTEKNKNIINSDKIKFVLDENEKTISLFKIYKKVKSILLNPEINIEKILKDKKLYNIIKEKKTLKDIRFNGQVYSKEVFHIKILELVYLKLIEWKKKCLNNKNTRKHYLKIKNEREKLLKIYKCKQKLIDEQMHLMKRNDIIFNKTNKITILKNKKIDPFYKRYLFEDTIKNKELNKKKDNNRSGIESENDIFFNYFQY